MSGDRLGLLSLRWDAVYCAVAGASLAALAGPVAPHLDVPATALGVIGIAVVAWGALVAWMASRLPRRRAVTITMCANLAATLLVATYSMAASGLLVMMTLLTVAVDIACFAVSQGLALRRLARADAR